MTDSQVKHLDHLKHQACKQIDRKYRAGAAEHGGDLQDMSIRDLLLNARDEAVDKFTYIQTALDKYDAQHPEQEIPNDDRILRGL
jgi:hypothetical protein